MSDVTLEDCKAACVANAACRSMDWSTLEKACNLNDVRANELGLVDNQYYSYIEINCGELYWWMFNSNFFIKESRTR